MKVYVITSYNPDSGESSFNPVVVEREDRVATVISEQMFIIAQDLGEDPDKAGLHNLVQEAWEEETESGKDLVLNGDAWDYESDVDNTTFHVNHNRVL